MSIRLNANKPTKKNAGLPSSKCGTIRLMRTQDVIKMPPVDSLGIACLGDFTLKNDAEFQHLYLTPKTQKYEINNTGDVDERLFKKKASGSYPGNDLQIFEFVKNNINQGYIVVYKEDCEPYSKIFGSPKNPLFLSPNYKSDSTGKGFEITLEQNTSDNIPVLFYNGEFPVYIEDNGIIEIIDIIGQPIEGPYKSRRIYLVAEEPTGADLAKFPVPVIFRICVDNKSTDVTYDKDGNRFEMSSGGTTADSYQIGPIETTSNSATIKLSPLGENYAIIDGVKYIEPTTNPETPKLFTPVSPGKLKVVIIQALPDAVVFHLAEGVEGVEAIDPDYDGLLVKRIIVSDSGQVVEGDLDAFQLKANEAWVDLLLNGEGGTVQTVSVHHAALRFNIISPATNIKIGGFRFYATQFLYDGVQITLRNQTAGDLEITSISGVGIYAINPEGTPVKLKQFESVTLAYHVLTGLFYVLKSGGSSTTPDSFQIGEVTANSTYVSIGLHPSGENFVIENGVKVSKYVAEQKEYDAVTGGNLRSLILYGKADPTMLYIAQGEEGVEAIDPDYDGVLIKKIIVTYGGQIIIPISDEFVPTQGTKINKPVTGLIEMFLSNDFIGLTAKIPGPEKKYAKIGFNGAGNPVMILQKPSGAGTSFTVADDSVMVDSTDPNFKGLGSNNYLGASIGDKNFTQKKYVDDLFIPVSSTKSGIVNNTLLQELGGVDKLINGHRIGRGKSNETDSVVFGVEALAATTTGKNNTAIGGYTLAATTTGSDNSAFGNEALYLNTTGNYNSAFGSNSLQKNTSGIRNTGIGTALYWNSTGKNNAALGYNAGYSSTTGSYNTLLGSFAGHQNGTGSYNVVIGYASMTDSTSGSTATNKIYSNNVFIGCNLSAPTATVDTLAIDNKGAVATNPANALIYGGFSPENRFVRINGEFYVSSTIRFYNPELGEERAGELNFNRNTYSYSFGNAKTTGTASYYNVSIGYDTLKSITSGVSNLAYGSYSLQALTTGYYNSVFGDSAGYLITTGFRNTLMGYSAMNRGNGSLNTAVGNGAGGGGTASFGDRNTLVGAFAGSNGQGTNNILIGVGAGNYENLSNKLIIHSNTSLTGYSNTSEGNFNAPQLSRLASALVTGDFLEKYLKINGTFSVNPAFLGSTGEYTKMIVAKPDGTFGFVDRPNAVNNSYSTVEVKTNGIWTDGKEIYRKAVSITIPANAVTGNPFLVSVSGAFEVISFEKCFMKIDGGARKFPPARGESGSNIIWNYQIENNVLELIMGVATVLERVITGIVEYTKPAL